MKRLLLAMDRLQVHDADFSFEVVIVDNDACMNAARVCSEIRGLVKYRLTYDCEPTIGLSSARNRALQHAADADALAFIDDDEEPAPDWLHKLLTTQHAFDADIVSGAVLPVFQQPPPASIRSCFERPRPATGLELREARAGNVLIKGAFLRQSQIRFDNSFSFSGGEDADFFRRMHAAGARIVSANEAVVYEHVPASRTTAWWLLRRAFRIGNADCRYELKQAPRLTARFMLAAAGIARMAAGAFLTVVCAPAGCGAVLNNARRICRGAGMLAGTCGHAHQEYGRTLDR